MVLVSAFPFTYGRIMLLELIGFALLITLLCVLITALIELLPRYLYEWGCLEGEHSGPGVYPAGVQKKIFIVNAWCLTQSTISCTLAIGVSTNSRDLDGL